MFSHFKSLMVFHNFIQLQFCKALCVIMSIMVSTRSMALQTALIVYHDVQLKVFLNMFINKSTILNIYLINVL